MNDAGGWIQNERTTNWKNFNVNGSDISTGPCIVAAAIFVSLKSSCESDELARDFPLFLFFFFSLWTLFCLHRHYFLTRLFFLIAKSLSTECIPRRERFDQKLRASRAFLREIHRSFCFSPSFF